MCVEAYGHEMEVSRRHINSAFMTFVVLNGSGQPCTLPMLKPEPGVSNQWQHVGSKTMVLNEMSVPGWIWSSTD